MTLLWLALPISFFVETLSSLAPFRPPCVPLNVVSPYQSTWSCADNLYDAAPQHWTGDAIDMVGLIKVDGVLHRFMGAAVGSEKTVIQKSVQVRPTTTIYKFSAGAVHDGVDIELSFVTPAIGLDSDILAASRPITYATLLVSSSSAQPRDVQVYFDTSGEGSVQSSDEEITWSRLNNGPKTLASKLQAMQIGTVSQKHLGQGSDRINWGYLILSTPKAAPKLHTAMQGANISRGAFANGSYFQLADDNSTSRKANDHLPVLSVAWQFDVVSGQPQERHLTLAYDQVVSMRFFGTDMQPLWRHSWSNALAMLEAADDAREKDLTETNAFDDALIANLSSVGGGKYATLASLVYRQVTGGTQEVWNPLLKEPWVFMKEISSDGDVSTVDVVYPAFPMFQYLYPEYFRLTLMPLMVYGNNETKAYGQEILYNLSWAPHHLGHWPISDLAPNKQEQMPVEESGNMLIMLSGIYSVQKSLQYLEPYWPMLRTWADFIVSSLPDPGNQLCTDDFEGASPHNTNLAAKGIVALEAFAGMLDAKGDKSDAESYRNHAFRFARNWTASAWDKDHYRIQFNLPGSWSLKYNLLWQKVLGLRAFPEEVFKVESEYYQMKLDTCGVPMDDRHPYTKSDWSIWAASLAETQEQFEAITSRVFKFADTTPDRAPLSDWYNIQTCKMQGFRARPVQGGFYAKMLVPPLRQDELIIL